MKDNWPTLKGRLNQPITTECEALEQLSKTMNLSDLAKKKLNKCKKRKKD